LREDATTGAIERTEIKGRLDRTEHPALREYEHEHRTERDEAAPAQDAFQRGSHVHVAFVRQPKRTNLSN
jgi:hypothetical protein